MSPDTEDMEKTLRQMFEENFERLRAENGHSLAPDVKEAAWQQVLMYWRKLRHIAESITDTEVRLNLPNQVTPKGRRFCIEGIVDIVKESDHTTMYDIKTHDVEFVRTNIGFYLKQLNVYAHIWQNLRGQRLDETAIISTPVPEKLTELLERGSVEDIQRAVSEWDPVVPVPFDSRNVQQTIQEFAEVVDAIEDNKFSSPPVSKLNMREGEDRTFGTRVCRNCDARFSCDAYRDYARAPRRKDAISFAAFYDTRPDEASQHAWHEATVPTAYTASTLASDL